MREDGTFSRTDFVYHEERERGRSGIRNGHQDNR